MKRLRFSIAIAIGLLIAGVPGAGGQPVEKSRAEVAPLSEKASLALYGGYLRGQSRELVFDSATGKKVSELFWKIDDTLVVGGALALRPVEWLTLTVGGWTPVRARNHMDDYDWLKEGQPGWSDWSSHGDTRLDRGHMIEAGVALQVAQFGQTRLFDGARLHLLAGYRWLNMKWTAFGGTYVYSSATGFRDREGTFPDGEAGISYEQWLETPYVGLGGSATAGRWSFSGELTGSLWGRADARDFHYDRTLIFEDRGRSMPMVAGELKASYALTRRLSLSGSFVWQKYFETKASTTTTNYTTGTVDHDSGEAAGMDHRSLLLNLGLRWDF